MAWKWWKPKDDPLKNKFVHVLEESVNNIDEDTDNRETEFKELDDTTKRSVMLSFVGIGETFNDIEKEDELNTDDLPKDQSGKWRRLRNRIAHNPLEVQGEDEYMQEHIDDLDEVDKQIDDYWEERVDETVEEATD